MSDPRPRQPPVPWYYWAFWMATLGVALVVFYGLLTPIWMGIRLVAWLRERSSVARRVP